jgi:hypothetical protein
LRTLTQQESSLNELRARTGTLIAAASIVTSFLGGAAIARDGRLFVCYRWATVALLGEVIFWSLQLAVS